MTPDENNRQAGVPMTLALRGDSWGQEYKIIVETRKIQQAMGTLYVRKGGGRGAKDGTL